MARAAGLDIGNRFAKAVVVERSGRRLTLVGFAVQAVPPTPEAKELDLGFVPELLARAGWRREPVAAAMRAGQVTVREMSLPFTEKAQLDQVARFQAENDLPFPLEEAILDYLPTGQEGETTDVMTFAARKTAVGGWLDALGDAGIDPCALGVEPLALAEGMRAMGAVPATPHLFLDLGASCAKVVCMEEGRPVSGRMLRFGAEADEGRYAEKLGRELLRFVALRADRATPTGITVVGGRATEPVLRLIEKALGMPAQPLRAAPDAPLEGAITPDFLSGGIVALGLALQAMETAEWPIDLRREEFRYRRNVERARAPLAFLLAAATILFAFLAVGMEVRRHSVQLQAGAVAAREQAIWSELSPEGARRPADLADWIRRETARLERARAGAADRSASALGTLRTLLAAIPPDVEVTVRAVDITPERARLDLSASSHSVAAEVVKAINTGTNWSASTRNMRYESGHSLFDLEATPPSKEVSHAN